MWDRTVVTCRNGGTGRRPGLKIPWDLFLVPVRPRLPAPYIAGWSSLAARRAHNPKVVRFKSHLRNQKRKQSIGLLFRFWNDVFRLRRTWCALRAWWRLRLVMCASRVSKEHITYITLRHRRNTSLCVSTSSLARKGKHHSLQTLEIMV